MLVLRTWPMLLLIAFLALWGCDHDHPHGDHGDHAHGDHAHGDHDEHGDHDDHDHGDHDEVHFPREYLGKIDFRVDKAEKRSLRPSVAVNATVRAASEGDARITSSFDGRVSAPSGGLPELGASVAAGDVVAYVLPRVDPGGVAALQGDVEKAEVQLERARREVERVAELSATGALPERRLADAESDLGVAQAELQRARQRRRELDGLQSGASSGRVAIRSPIDGVVVERSLVGGSFVTAGTPLLRVIDRRTLWLEAMIPEADLPGLNNPAGAWFYTGSDELVDLKLGENSRLVSAGEVIDKRTRTAQMIFEIEDPAQALRVGAFVRAHIYGEDSEEVLAIPASAILDEQGMDVVFVVKSRESFERRVLKLGQRDGQFVEVLQGLQPGEDVVSRGAYFIRLAAAASEEVGHGHSH